MTALLGCDCYIRAFRTTGLFLEGSALHFQSWPSTANHCSTVNLLPWLKMLSIDIITLNFLDGVHLLVLCPIKRLHYTVEYMLHLYFVFVKWIFFIIIQVILGSIVVSIPVCHTGDRGSIPRQGVFSF